MSKNKDVSELDVSSEPITLDSIERDLPLVVLGEMVIMPHMTVPLQVGQGKCRRGEKALRIQQAFDTVFEIAHPLVGKVQIARGCVFAPRQQRQAATVPKIATAPAMNTMLGFQILVEVDGIEPTAF